MSDANVTVTLAQQGDDIDVEIWAPAFVDYWSGPSIDEALMWARGRLEGTDPFVPYAD